MINDELLFVESELISLRPANRSDVPLIYALRRSSRAKFLNPTSPDISHQYEYYENYLMRHNSGDEIYFVICDKRQKRDVGVTRVTNLTQHGRFGWEGLVIDSDATPGVAIDAIVTIYATGFLGAKKSVCGPWKVPKGHLRVQRLHKNMGIAKIIDTEREHFIYQALREDFVREWPKFVKQGFGTKKWSDV